MILNSNSSTMFPTPAGRNSSPTFPLAREEVLA
eukprot:g38882.t1